MKAIKKQEDMYLGQTLNYLKVFILEIELMLNFGSKSLTFNCLVL